MSDDNQGALSNASPGGVAGEHAAVDSLELRVAPATGSEFNSVHFRLIPIACWRVDDVRFRFDSSFPVLDSGSDASSPNDLRAEMQALAAMVKAHPGSPLSIFGHADPVGDDAYNKTLSGRRATAIYALLTRNTSLWQTLYNSPFGGDNWGDDSLTSMQNATGLPRGTRNADLFSAYMDLICGKDFKLAKTDFLGQGADSGGKGDYQGCGEFNPVLVFAQEKFEQYKTAQQKKDKAAIAQRNAENAPNRRVLVLLFRKGSKIDPAKWPCPRVSEGGAGCQKRFWSDGETRRSTHSSGADRVFDTTKDTFACRFFQRISDGSPCHAMVPPVVVAQINATVPATKAIRDPTHKARPDNALTPSKSDKESLTDNKPVVLVRGCLDVQLEAVTVPPNLPVQWFVKPNENDGDAPTITPTEGGKKATLKTDKTGSFSVIAAVGVTKVVWNVVFVWVNVDTATSIKTTRDNYHDLGVQGGWQSFQSGDFVLGKLTWEAQVDATVIGGGKDKKLGIDRVRLGVLQNGVADTLSGIYTKGGSLREAPFGGLPVVDSNGDADSHPMLSMAISATVKPDNTGPKRTIWTADSPGGVFPVWHRDNKQFLSSVSGIMGFEAAVASLSADAPNAFCVHAKMAWHADFAAKIVYSGNPPVGKYTPNGATTVTDAEFSLISEASGGQDAGVAGFETFEPRWNNGRDYTHWSP